MIECGCMGIEFCHIATRSVSVASLLFIPASHLSHYLFSSHIPTLYHLSRVQACLAPLTGVSVIPIERLETQESLRPIQDWGNIA